MLQGKKILLGISGSIAAYKAAGLVRLLIREGAEVKVVMTSSASEFITPLTLSTLSRHPVLSGFAVNDTWTQHVHLGRWADLMLIAPLSCNTLSKMAHGLCDNLLLAVYLSATCPVAVAPAMDEDMWIHPATRKNLLTIESFGHQIIPVEKGELASGLYGEGRMAEPEHILEWVKGFFLTGKQLSGKKVLVTAGPTYESIDPVRFIGNHSSGKMGISLAQAFWKRGAEVTLILGPTSLHVPASINTVRVVSAEQMYQEALSRFPQTDLAVMAAAVADYRPVEISHTKIKKSGASLQLELEKTPDILKALGERKKKDQVLVGFALETDNEKENALKKLREKNADFIVLNSLRHEGAGFAHDTNRISIFDKTGQEISFGLKSKDAVAEDILNTIIQ